MFGISTISPIYGESMSDILTTVATDMCFDLKLLFLCSKF